MSKQLVLQLHQTENHRKAKNKKCEAAAKAEKRRPTPYYI